MVGPKGIVLPLSPTGRIAILFWRNLSKTLFLVSAGILFTLSLSAFITGSLLAGVNRNIAMPLQVIYATLIGFASPEPRYIIYPILAKLREFGVSAGVLVALISAHVLIEPAAFFIEIGLFGWRFPLKRILVSFILVVLTGLATDLLFRGL